MVFVKRNSEQEIIAIFSEDTEDNLEAIDAQDEEILNFLTRCSQDREMSLTFLKLDLELIRVIEDVIKILMSKNIISITDFPQPVIEKLIKRKKIRSQLSTGPGNLR